MITKEGEILDKAYDHWMLADLLKKGDSPDYRGWFPVIWEPESDEEEWKPESDQEIWIALKETGYLEQNNKGEFRITAAGIKRFHDLTVQENPKAYHFTMVKKDGHSYLRVRVGWQDVQFGINDDARLTLTFEAPGIEEYKQIIHFVWLGVEEEEANDVS